MPKNKDPKTPSSSKSHVPAGKPGVPKEAAAALAKVEAEMAALSPRAASLLDRAAEQPCDLRVARFASLLTIASHLAFPGLVWRAASRFEGFTLRPMNGDYSPKPWAIARAACGHEETGSLAFFLLGKECDAAIQRYLGPSGWAPDTLEPWLRPRWSGVIQA